MKTKRIISLILIIAAIVCILVPAQISGAQNSIKLGINDSITASPGGISPIFVNNVCYVPIEVFTDHFGFTYSYDGVSRTLSLYGRDRALYFNMRQNIATDNNLEVYYTTCYYENSTFMLPARVMCEAFSLRYSFLPQINTLRLRTNSASLSDAQFTEKYTPKAINEPPVSEERVPDVYLIINEQQRENIDGMLDSLSSQNIGATFFLGKDIMKQNPELPIKIIAHGHALGIDLSSTGSLTEYSTGELISYLNEQQLHIATLYKTLVCAVYLSANQYSSLSDEARAEIAGAGYTLWREQITALGNVNAVTGRITGTQRAMRVLLPGNDIYILRGLASYLSEKGASFNTIKLTTKP